MATPQPTAQSIEELERRLAGIDGVEKVFEFSENLAGIQANEQLTVGRVIGIKTEDLFNFPLISNNIQFGSLAGFGQGRGSAHQVAIGTHLASQLGLLAGDRVRVMTSKTRSNAIGPPVPISKIYTVGAIFETGLFTTDQTYIYMELSQSQLLFDEGKRSGELQLRLNDADEIDKILPKVIDISPEPIWTQTWKDRNSTTATALRTEQIAMRMIFVIVVIISTFPILAAMIMLVKNKAKDIAILRTIGGTRGTVLRVFFIAGATIGFLGTIVGLGLGLLLCLNIGTVQAIIEWVTGQPLFPADVYGISTGIPAKVVPSEVIGVALCGFIISAVATFFPAWSAAKTEPVEALRYE